MFNISVKINVLKYFNRNIKLFFYFLVVRASSSKVLGDPNQWVVNGVKRRVSHLYGFGMIDANAMVHLAKAWTNVPEQIKCEVEHEKASMTVSPGTSEFLALKVGKECNDIKYLEHVQALLTLKAQRRGEIEIFLTSAKGTQSCLLSNR